MTLLMLLWTAQDWLCHPMRIKFLQRLCWIWAQTIF